MQTLYEQYSKDNVLFHRQPQTEIDDTDLSFDQSKVSKSRDLLDSTKIFKHQIQFITQ